METENLKTFFRKISLSADAIIEKVLIAYFVFGLFLATFYDTWLIAGVSGSLVLVLYFGTKLTFRKESIHHYIASLGLGIFMAQFIYQMHGMFEMHFTAFMAIAVMVFYRNWKLYIPITAFVVVHHASFAYIQYIGLRDSISSYQNIYFTQLEYMDLTTFLFHAGLFAVFTGFVGYHSYLLRRETTATARNIIDLESQRERTEVNIEFANQIAEGNYSEEYQLQEGDNLGEALLNMRQNLKHSTQREHEDKFINTGLTEAARIIRNNDKDLSSLADEMIAFIIKYIEANQGALFIKETQEGEDKLVLKGCYAYERKKYINLTLDPGQGLVGQCYLEKQHIYLRELPEDYINITSGLGEATPRSATLIPLIYNEIVEGVLEIASFAELSQYQIDFLLKAGESIASAISNVRTAEITKNLYEDSKSQATQLQAQEEEMRQNMEELTATQEEIKRNSSEMEATLNAINASDLLYMEMSLEGEIRKVNETLSQLLNIDTSLRTYEYMEFVDPRIRQSEAFTTFWNNLTNGLTQKGTYTLRSINGHKISVKGSFSLINNHHGVPVKIVLAAHDFTPVVQLLSSMNSADIPAEMQNLINGINV